MSHLYRMSEWECTPGYWYVNDIEELNSEASKWWTPVRMLGITPEEYVKILKEQFNAQHIRYTAKKNVLIFSFKTQAEARKFKNWMNAQARKKQFICGN